MANLGLRRGAASAVALLALGSAACSSAGGDTGSDAAPTAFPQADDPGDPEGFVPIDTGAGLEWERVDHPGFSLGYVVYSSTQFVTINTRDDGVTALLTSPDGTTWTDAGRTFEDIEARDLAVSRQALAVWGERRDSLGDDPASADSASADSASPEPDSADPDSAAPELASAEPSQPEPASPEPSQPESSQPEPSGNIARIHFSADNGATWHARDIRAPGLDPDADNPGSQIVTAAVRGTTLLVSAFFRSDESSHLLRLDLDDPDAPFTTVDLEPAGTFIGDITVTASGIVMIGADADTSRIYVESADGFDLVDPDTRIATLLSDGRTLYANEWESYGLLRSLDLGATWTPVEQDFRSFSQTFVGPSGMAGTNTISTSEPWAIDDPDGPPRLGTDALDRTRPETFISWSPDGSAWHHETATSAFGFPAFAYLAIGDGVVLAAATPLFGEPYEEGTVASQLYLARPT